MEHSEYIFVAGIVVVTCVLIMILAVYRIPSSFVFQFIEIELTSFPFYPFIYDIENNNNKTAIFIAKMHYPLCIVMLAG